MRRDEHLPPAGNLVSEVRDKQRDSMWFQTVLQLVYKEALFGTGVGTLQRGHGKPRRTRTHAPDRDFTIM